jgi:hypothetical protein
MFAMMDSMYPCVCTEPPVLELLCCGFLDHLLDGGVIVFVDLSSEMGNLLATSFKSMIQ